MRVVRTRTMTNNDAKHKNNANDAAKHKNNDQWPMKFPSKRTIANEDAKHKYDLK